MFQIFNRNQGLQILNKITGDESVVVARLINTPNGWFAHRGETGSDPEAVNVSRLVNQHDGPERIAALLNAK